MLPYSADMMKNEWDDEIWMLFGEGMEVFSKIYMLLLRSSLLDGSLLLVCMRIVYLPLFSPIEAPEEVFCMVTVDSRQ